MGFSFRFAYLWWYELVINYVHRCDLNYQNILYLCTWIVRCIHLLFCEESLGSSAIWLPISSSRQAWFPQTAGNYFLFETRLFTNSIICTSNKHTANIPRHIVFLSEEVSFQWRLATLSSVWWILSRLCALFG